ncbi:MAG: ribonuclease III domain-containing protein [Bacteroidota bacterium]|nr:ribonuclease III domain-containing protein [Bacteroidota bacterium]
MIRKYLLLKFSKNKEFYQKIFNVLGFYPSKLSLYKIALTHNSFHQNYDKKEKKVNNERLEYLGDSVLGMVIAEKLYLKFPYQDEGFLTEMRSKIVGRNKLNAIGRKMGVIGLLQYDKKLHSNPNIIDTLCGNALEAIIGAMYLDKGFTFTKSFISQKILEQHIDFDALVNEELSYKAKLIKWCQKERKKIDYMVHLTETEHKRNIYTIHILIDGELVMEGRNHSKKLAEELASEKYCAQNNL